jgi:hypothetical protein
MIRLVLVTASNVGAYSRGVGEFVESVADDTADEATSRSGFVRMPLRVESLVTKLKPSS